jgi:hypothetical protein
LPGLRDADPPLTPKFVIRDEQLVFNPLLLFTALVGALGPVIESLAGDDDTSRIIAAIDALITQAFG